MHTQDLQRAVESSRLAALRRLGLLDTPAEEAFDRLGRLAAKVLGTPIALVSRVDEQRQFFKSCLGLPEPWASWRDTPLSHSFCQHVVASSKPLVINDARLDLVLKDNPGIHALGMIAYLGIPLKLESGEVLGSFCVIDSAPRNWSEEDVQTLTVLAGCVMTEIELRNEINQRKAAAEQTEKLNRALQSKAAELEIANADLQSFSHSVSHDLRSPLRNLDTLFDLLVQCAGDGLGEECRQYINCIRSSSGRMRGVIEGLLVLSGVGEGKLVRERVDLSETARTIVCGAESGSPERKLGIFIQPNMEAYADRRLLQILLENLLGNALKFTSKRPEARIEFASMPGEGPATYFVRDNGVGFDMNQAGALFVPFQRLESSREFEGSGIGLGTVWKIIQRHGGRVWGEGKVNEGATFYFTIPPGEN
jgi:signal transduction histidine kinase